MTVHATDTLLIKKMQYHMHHKIQVKNVYLNGKSLLTNYLKCFSGQFQSVAKICAHFLQYWAHISVIFLLKKVREHSTSTSTIRNLPHWQENCKYRAYIPGKTSIIPPSSFCDGLRSPCSNVVFPWYL